MGMFWDNESSSCRKHPNDCPLESLSDTEFEIETSKVWDNARRVGRLPLESKDHLTPSCEECIYWAMDYP